MSDVIVDSEIITGNAANFEDFKKHFLHHDKQTLDGYFRIAKKKQSMMIIRRLSRAAPQMQIIIVPYKLAEAKGGIREAIKSRFFPNTGWIRALAVDPKRLYVFGDLIPQNESDGFTKPIPVKVKRKPFQPRGQE